MTRRKYQRRIETQVTALCLALDTKGFFYEKWGATQHCKAGDWIVERDGQLYTVDAEVFRRTYVNVGPGRYKKVTPVWAEIASERGVVRTKEGSTVVEPGDFIVSNDEAGQDTWAMNAAEFRQLYVLDESEDVEHGVSDIERG
jgi:hypothetical protein